MFSWPLSMVVNGNERDTCGAHLCEELLSSSVTLLLLSLVLCYAVVLLIVGT